jgi:chemotaxis protein MotB
MVYADFTTAMMAFFLVLWLASTASEAQRDLLADFFNPVAVSREKSGADSVLGGRAADVEGGSLSAYGADTSRPVAAPPVMADIGDVKNPPFTGVEMAPQNDERRFTTERGGPSDARLDEIERKLRLALTEHAERTGLKNVVLIERLPSSVRLQISENYGFMMFDSGRTDLLADAEQLFVELGAVLGTVPNTVRVVGHTDGAVFRGRGGNWGLSALRAEAARSALAKGGLLPDQTEAVEGRADTDPLIAEDRLDPRNRRITVTINADTAASSGLLYSGQ